MSYFDYRPSPRPGELYNHFGPPIPPRSNTHGYSRSEAGGTRPGRPPQRYAVTESSYRGGSSRPSQRSGYHAGYYDSYEPSPSSSRRPYNNKPAPRNFYEPDFPDPSSSPPPRPSAMSKNRAPPPHPNQRPDAWDHHDGRRFRQAPPPFRGHRPQTPDEYYSDLDEPERAQHDHQSSGEAQASWSWNTLKKTVWGDSTTDSSQSKPPFAPPEDERVPDDHKESSNTLWHKITTVGANFQKKITGDEGYASDASDYQGESHLIRIMKKYYIEKAESAQHLPDWLFTAEELEEAYSRRRSEREQVHEPQRGERRGHRPDPYGDPEGRGPGRGGLSDIYDSIDQGYHSRQGSSSTKQSFDSGYGSSSSTRRRMRGRYEDERDPDPMIPPPGRNRLAMNASSSALREPRLPMRYPLDQPPPSSSYESRSHRGPPAAPSSYPRRPENPPGSRGPPALKYAGPPKDFFPSSSQSDRYPTPRTTKTPYRR